MKTPCSKLPWHLMETGFKWNSSAYKPPRIYCTGDDLEMVCTIEKDSILTAKIQDNIKNAEYIVEACNNYPKAIELLKEILNDWENHQQIYEVSSYERALKFLKQTE